MAKETRTCTAEIGSLVSARVKGVELEKKKCPPVSNHKIMAFLGGRLRKKNFLNAKTDQHQFSPNTEYPYIFKRRGQEIQ